MRLLPRNSRKGGRNVRVVSLVCWELFNKKPQVYRDAILPPIVEKRLNVEVGHYLGWREYFDAKGIIQAVRDFGASGAFEKM